MVHGWVGVAFEVIVLHNVSGFIATTVLLYSLCVTHYILSQNVQNSNMHTSKGMQSYL